MADITVKKARFGAPDFAKIKRDDPKFMSKYYQASAYLRTEENAKTMKAHALKWIKANRKEYDLNKVRNLPDYRFEVMGRLCYIMNHHGDIPETAPAFIERELLAFLTYAAEKADVAALKELEDEAIGLPKRSIQDYIKEKAGIVMNDFDVEVDNIMQGRVVKLESNPLAMMRNAGIKLAHTHTISSYYGKVLEEISLALTPIDKTVVDANHRQLVEGYSATPVARLRLLKKFLEKIISDVGVLSVASKTEIKAKKAKKPSKKKVVNLSKLVSKIKYQKEDSALAIASINPLDILGSKQCWVYNTRTRKLGRYEAFDEAGLSVKGSMLINFSKEKSVQKSLKKPKDHLALFKGNQKLVNAAFNDLTSVSTALNGRFNDQLIILKAYR